MQRPARRLNPSDQQFATAMARKRIDSLLKRARAVEMDTERAAREESLQCKACYYADHIGGAAMTTQPCSACGVTQQFGSTATMCLCAACAAENRLCRRCGGDIDLRSDRTQWAQIPTQTAATAT